MCVFFKQKTAYEMRISDWSSDVCSSDLLVIDTLSPVLADLPDALQIDGHTNQARGKPKHYASDWDLASARAITVLRRLSEQGGISAERLSADRKSVV